MKRHRSRLIAHLLSVAPVVPIALSLACGAKEVRPLVGTDDGRQAVAERKARAVEMPVTGHLVASIGERAIGPFVSRRPGAAGVVVWVSGIEGTGRRLHVVSIGPNGAPRGGDTILANVSIDTSMLTVKPIHGSAPGFLVTWTALTERGKSLWSLAVSDDGSPRGKPVELTRTNDDLVWVDVVPTEHGALCLWAEETQRGDANIVAASIDTDGKVRGTAIRVARGVIGWHVLGLPGGVGLSVVDGGATAATSAAAEPKGKRVESRTPGEARGGGSLAFHRLDADGHAVAPPVFVTTKPIVSGDVEVVRDGARFVFAWTDRTSTEPSVSLATLDDKNAVEAPRKIADARGGAALLSLASGPSGAAVLFEAPVRRKGESRNVHLARVGADLQLERRPLTFEVASRGGPELAATATGFALLGTMRDCEPETRACLNASEIATLLRTDAKSTVVQRETFSFQTDPASFGWGLGCEGDACLALAASSDSVGTPTRIRTAAVRPRTNAAQAAPVSEPPAKQGPRIADISAIAAGETVVDIATTRFGAASLVATLSAKAVDSDERSRRRGKGIAEDARTGAVTLATRIVDDRGVVSSPVILSTRALHVGGVAIASAEKPEDGGAIAWVARENGEPQVHVTRLDKRGRRTNDVQLTTTKGDAANVTLTWVGGGWIVAWVDGRSGNGEVYATKVALDLSRVAREERITNAPGDASDLVALANGDDVWLSWSDPRESPRDGIGDIFVSAVRTRDAKRSFDEQKLLSTAGHSRSPRLAKGADAMHVAWIEEAPPGAETPSSSGFGAFWATLDPNGKPKSRPTRVPLAGEGAATSVAIEAEPDVHLVVARSTPEALSLDAVDLSAAPPAVGSLLSLDGPSTLDVALVFDGGDLYFNDDGPRPADRRARRARISWAKAPR